MQCKKKYSFVNNAAKSIKHHQNKSGRKCFFSMSVADRVAAGLGAKPPSLARDVYEAVEMYVLASTSDNMAAGVVQEAGPGVSAGRAGRTRPLAPCSANAAVATCCIGNLLACMHAAWMHA